MVQQQPGPWDAGLPRGPGPCPGADCAFTRVSGVADAGQMPAFRTTQRSVRGTGHGVRSHVYTQREH